MKTKTFSIDIKAPKEKVWYSLWDDENFRDWTKVFSEGSHAVSDWQEGSTIHFMDPSGSGMHSKITVNKPFDEMTFRHLSDVKDNVVQPESSWSNAEEKYILTENNGITTVSVAVYITEEFEGFFNTTFPKAMQRIKEIAESSDVKPITVCTSVESSLEKVWDCFTKPEHIVNWNFASDDWCCPKAENDLRVGGKFSSTMASKDETTSFDFEGIYNEVEKHKKIAYAMADGRKVTVRFNELEGKVIVTENFDPEHTNPLDMQRGGWQSILDNFKKYVESN